MEKLFDRSIVVGRHVDTAEYGCTLPPLRRRLSQLFELNVRTHLEQLAYLLRGLEAGLQRGLGAGHGRLAVVGIGAGN